MSRHPESGLSIHRVLRSHIVTLRLKPGARLSENELAAQFGTSRTPVREALIRLGEEGLIEVLPQRGSFVTRISLAGMQRARFVREALEIAIVRRLAQSGLSERGHARARAALLKQSQANGAAERFTLADDAFHRALAEDVDISQLWPVLEREKSQFDRIRFLSLPTRTPVDLLIAQHEDILDAILQADAARAEQALHVHLSEVLKITEKLAAENPELIVNDTGAGSSA
ncbi:GntR family transcriptional regulator [Bosea sp. (in: a-proteobacteria)]|uniref:GntR family transcriptional regulator n=1 Tax=Bosea sp. (in: a-proteobacteria) TaxID=1871050 RepID=UPI00333F77FE